MNIKVVISIIVAIVTGGIFLLLPGDEEKIKDNLQDLAEYGSTVDNEAMLDSLQKAALAVKLCATPFHVDYATRGINKDFTEKELTDRILMVKKTAPGVRYLFADIQVDMQGKTNAQVAATMRLHGTDGEGSYTDAYETALTVEKIDGDWLFTSFSIVEFLEK